MDKPKSGSGTMTDAERSLLAGMAHAIVKKKRKEKRVDKSKNYNKRFGETPKGSVKFKLTGKSRGDQ